MADSCICSLTCSPCGCLEPSWNANGVLHFSSNTILFPELVPVFLSAIIQPASQIPIIGASGAIYGLLLAFALMYPNRVVYLNFLIPIKVKYFVMIFAAIELFSSIRGGGDGIAHITHLSGMIFGYLFCA